MTPLDGSLVSGRGQPSWPTVHMFAGQGDFPVGSLVRAARDVDVLSRAAREVFDEIDPVAVELGLPRLGAWLLGAAPPSGRDLAEAPTGSVQLALFGTSMAVHRALCRSHGRPDAVVGVSFGEIAALTAVDVFTVADGARIAYDLALVLADCPGGLTLLACSEESAVALLDRVGARDVAVACVNDDQGTVVSGPVEQLAVIEAGTVPAIRLRLPFASHHPALGAAAERFADAVRRYVVKPAGLPVYSAVAGRVYTDGEDIPDRLADCLIRPARLPEVLLQAAQRHTPAIFFESGPGSALSRNARRVLTGTATAVHAPLDGTGFLWSRPPARTCLPTWRSAMSVSTPTSPNPTSPNPAPLSARDELDRLIHGRCDPAFRAALQKALAADPAPVRPDPADRARRIARRMRRLGAALPGSRQMFEEPAQLAELHAWVAVAEPALCMVAITHHLLCLGSMARLAPDHAPLKEQFEALESGRTVGAYLITEVGRSNSHLSVRSRAEYDPLTREFVLQTPDPEAAKFSEVSFANGVAHTVVVLARVFVGGTDCGVFPFVVDLTDEGGLLPGVDMSAPLELSAVPLDYAQIRFQQLRLPYERWLRDSADISEDGVFHDPLGSTDRRVQRTLCVGQGLWATLPAVAAAVCRQSAVLALRYARKRTTQGRLAPGTALLDHRTQQHAVFGALADAFVLTCVAQRALTVWQESLVEEEAGTAMDGAMTFSPWAAVSRPLAAYKAFAVRTAARVTADCQLHCGFSGHLDANRLAGYHGFHHAFEAAGGDSQLIFYDLGMALSSADEASRLDAPPAQAQGKGDTGWWSSVAALHEQRLARDLRRAVGAGGPEAGFETWNPLLGLAGELGEIHASRAAAEDVTRTVARISDPGLRAVAERLARLSGLLAARRWSGPLLTAGTLAPDDFEGLTQRIDRLCDELMPDLPLVEDAFAYPDEIVRAPLGAADYNRALADSVTWHHGGDA